MQTGFDSRLPDKMKVSIFGKKGEEIKNLVLSAGFTVVDEGPDFIISYGGDGTLMKAEAERPGVPKIVLKGSRICKKCEDLPNAEVLKLVAVGKYALKDVHKLEATFDGRTIRGLNDIVIHNANLRHAIRYRVSVNGRDIGDEIIGDGVVIATPFGSTGYYRSITRSLFETGTGLAFNNSTEPVDHMVLREADKIEITIERGPALVYADNQLESFELREGDRVGVVKSEKSAKIVRVL